MAEHEGRRRRHEEHEEHEEHVNHEAWIIPYADMVTLLMALFLMLFAMGRLDLAKFQSLAESLGQALNPTMAQIPGGSGIAPGQGTGPDGPSRAEAAEQALRHQEQLAELRRREEVRLGKVQERIRLAARRQGVLGSVDFRDDPRGLVVTIMSDKVLFPSGSAELQPAGYRVLRAIAHALEDIPNQIVVEGHTDDRPISTGTYPSNWELSTARATQVLRTLVSRYGLQPYRVSAAGYADQRPVATNDTAAGRARNRRVELVVVSSVPRVP